MIENLFQNIEEISARSFNYKDYVEHIKMFNTALRNNLKEIFSDVKTEPFVIVTTGSDGRFEKGSLSPIELILISDKENFNFLQYKPLSKCLDEAYKNHFLDNYLEIKNPKKDSVSYIEFNGVKILSPNRVFDYSYIGGQREFIKLAKNKLKEEIKKNKNIKDRIKKKINEHKKICTSGEQKYKGQTLIHFKNGVSYYDPNTNQQSFKQGPLRLVQYALVRDKIKAIREDAQIKDLILYSFPTNTIEAIVFLEATGDINLSRAETQDLIDNYKYFLHKYHISQQEFKHKDTNIVPYDKAEVNERLESLVEIASKQIMKITSY